jgi:hypothetical protein
MSENIDITMTSVLRPNMLNGTLTNIKNRVCKDQMDRFRLIINVDPVGESVDPMQMVQVAQNHFDNVVYNITSTPSFPKAVKWVWSQVNAPFVFHWEDDVDILYDIDIENMIYILNKYEKLSSLRLYRANTPNKNRFHEFRCNWIYNNDGFYLADRWQEQFGLNPILIKKAFTDEATTRLKDDFNPEKQFRYNNIRMLPLISEWQYGLYTRPGMRRLVDGRKGQNWKNKIGFDKPKGKTFLQWERK